MENNNTLCKKWINFLNVVFDPWVLILLITTILFISFSNLSYITDKNIIAILSLIISLFSAILGGILANRWGQMTEEKILVARGKSAIRSLKLILLNISKIEKRTKYYITEIDKEKIDFLIIISNFEEIIEKCHVLEEEIISSIENWTDIIPEVENLKTQIGIITEMKIIESDLLSEVENLKNQLSVSEELGVIQRQEMQEDILETQKVLSSIKKKLEKAENKLNNTVLSGLTSSLNISNLGEKFIYNTLGDTESIFSDTYKLKDKKYSGISTLNTTSIITNQPTNK